MAAIGNGNDSPGRLGRGERVGRYVFVERGVENMTGVLSVFVSP